VWPFGRRRNESASAADAVADAAGPDAGPDAGAPAHEWAQLPPVQRITDDAPSVISPRFERDLASWQTPVILRQLDHLVSSHAPAGVFVTDAVLAAQRRPEAAASPRAAELDVAGSVVTFEPPRRATATLTEQPRQLSAVADPTARPNEAEWAADRPEEPASTPAVAPTDAIEPGEELAAPVLETEYAPLTSAADVTEPSFTTPPTADLDVTVRPVDEPVGARPLTPTTPRRLGLGAPLTPGSSDQDAPSLQRSAFPTATPAPPSAPRVDAPGADAPTPSMDHPVEVRPTTGPAPDGAEAAASPATDPPAAVTAPDPSNASAAADDDGGDADPPRVESLEPEATAPVLPLTAPMAALESPESGPAMVSDGPAEPHETTTHFPLPGDQVVDESEVATPDRAVADDDVPASAPLTGDRPALVDPSQPDELTVIQRQPAATGAVPGSSATLPNSVAGVTAEAITTSFGLPPTGRESGPTTVVPGSLGEETDVLRVSPVDPDPEARATVPSLPLDAAGHALAVPERALSGPDGGPPALATDAGPEPPPSPADTPSASPPSHESPTPATAPMIAQRLPGPASAPRPGVPTGSASPAPSAVSDSLAVTPAFLPMMGPRSWPAVAGEATPVLQTTRLDPLVPAATAPLTATTTAAISRSSPHPPVTESWTGDAGPEPLVPVEEGAVRMPANDELDLPAAASARSAVHEGGPAVDTRSILGTGLLDARVASARLDVASPGSAPSASARPDTSRVAVGARPSSGLGAPVQRQTDHNGPFAPSLPASVPPSSAASFSPSHHAVDSPAARPAAGIDVSGTAAPSSATPSPWRDAGDVAVQSLIAQRQPDGSVVFNFDGAPDSGDRPPDADVQRASTDGGGASSPAAPPPTGGVDTTDLDELAKRLYGRLRVMLKHELRLDHERAGSLIQRR
jgi:hypothetical protein